MELLDFSRICRVCLCEGTMMSLFKVSMFKKMMACASIQVWPNDGLPGQICAKCASRLHISFQFKKQCEKSDLKLKQLLTSMSSQEAKKLIEEMHPNIEIVVDNQQQQVNTQSDSSQVFVENGTASLDNGSSGSPRYDHFMTISQTTNSMGQINYENLSGSNQIVLPNFTVQNHLGYNVQYSVPALHPQVVQIEMRSQDDIEQAKNEESLRTTDLKSDIHAQKKDEHVGKACSTCGKIFKTNIKLNRHMKIHTTLPTDLPHKCPVCGKGFSHSGNFKTHLRIHSNERPYKCPVCNKACRQAQDLEKHMRTHTGEKPHQCRFCPKAFTTSSNLIAHTRTHTGERPYVCCVCQKAFCQSNELTKHMRTHTGEKSHICDICNRGFNGSSGLLAHRRSHTGERPYACQICQRSFTSSNCLAAHVKTHNKPDPIRCRHCEANFSSLLNLRDHVKAEHNVSEGIQCSMCEENFDKVSDYKIHLKTHQDAQDS